MVTQSLKIQAPKVAPVNLTGKTEWMIENRMKYIPSCVPNLLEPDSMKRNGEEIKRIIDQKINEKFTNERFLIDQITFFLPVDNAKEGGRYSPELRQRLLENKTLGYDYIPFAFKKFFETKERRRDFRVMGRDDNGVRIRVNEKELALIIKEGGNSFKQRQEKKRIDEYHMVIPYSNIVEVVFIKKKY